MDKFVAYNNPIGHRGDVQRGFQMTFANGITVSVAFGSMNYCDNGKTTAEVWCWDANGNSVSVPGYGKDVVGHLSPEEVLSYMNLVRCA